jgi:hypothetical protein
MGRQLSPSVAQRNEDLLARIRALKAESPFWGYRRIWASLHFVEQLPVNKNRIREGRYGADDTHAERSVPVAHGMNLSV